MDAAAESPPSSTVRGGVRRWMFVVFLILPATVPYLRHCLAGGEGFPTGFIQGDQPGYMAVAREYFDRGFHLTYSNPFVPYADGPAIYFQPQTFVLGLLWFCTRLSPGFLFVLFGLVCALVCARVALGLYGHCAGSWDWAARAGALLFFWGGGFFVLAGVFSSPLHTFSAGEEILFGNLMRWDPFGGWWFLNFGRNLIMPLEAYYHAVFFGAILAYFREKYLLSGALLLLLCASHPYSGSELLLVLLVWGAAEGFAFGPRGRVRYFFGGVLLIGVLHAGYYLLLLPNYPEHRALMHQWSKWWVLDWRSAVFGYGLVAIFAAAAVLGRGTARGREQRLLLLWFLIALVLVKHELFTDHPVEPLHFTRGYVWTPLFLLGLPALLRLLRHLRRRGTVLSGLALGAVVVAFLLDNGTWLAAVGRGYLIEDVRTTAEQREVFGVLNAAACSGSVVLTPDREVALLSTVYTPLRPWTTHLRYTDGDIERREEVQNLILRGESAPAWKGWNLAVVLDRWPGSMADTTSVRALAALGGRQHRLLENGRYSVVLVERAGEKGEKGNPP